MMLGYLGYRAVRGQWRMYQRSRNAPGGPWTFEAVLFCVLPFTVLWMLTAPFQRHAALFWVLLGVNALLTAPLALRPAARGIMSRRILDAYQPGTGNAGQLLADRAGLLDELDWQQQVLADRAAHPYRSELTARVLSVPCPVCAAQPGTACPMGIAVPVALVNERPAEFCHLERMQSAVRHGIAGRDDIFAQFGNNAPRGLF
jgi:hypothetical protein